MTRLTVLSDAQHKKRLQSAQHFRRRADRLFHIRRAVRRGNKAGLELRGREVNAFGQHPEEKLFDRRAPAERAGRQTPAPPPLISIADRNNQECK